MKYRWISTIGPVPGAPEVVQCMYREEWKMQEKGNISVAEAHFGITTIKPRTRDQCEFKELQMRSSNAVINRGITEVQWKKKKKEAKTLYASSVIRLARIPNVLHLNLGSLAGTFRKYASAFDSHHLLRINSN